MKKKTKLPLLAEMVDSYNLVNGNIRSYYLIL
jgi:hypothetical protein